MPSNIQEFKSSFSYDLARKSKFNVYMKIPGFGVDPRHNVKLPTTESLSFRCESAQLPSRAIATEDVTFYGPSEKFPYQTNYENMALTFICSDNMEEKALFDIWLDWINPTVTHDFAYKEEYVTDITIMQYDVGGNPTHQVILKDAFPIEMNPMDLSWDSSDTHKITVVFAYTLWDSYTFDDPAVSGDNSPRSIVSLSNILQAATFALSAKKALASGNPYALLSVAGAASSLLPGLGVNGTLSSIIGGKPQGGGNIDSYVDKYASAVNSNQNSINLGSLF